mmetsp:Transcript_24112/g.53378  ORF Transcript_24112/g.53378 Transcript_24112/m.53378 type:complete len:93 (+) Transcript_24112:34-312(+)
MRTAAAPALLLILSATGASAFAPLPQRSFGGIATSLEAKHVNKKATKKHADRRPKKHMRSDIVRKPVEYPEVPSVPEYTISDAPASPAAKPV